MFGYQATQLIRSVVGPLIISLGLILNTVSFLVMKNIKSSTANYMTYLALIDSGVLSVGLVSLWLHSANHNTLPIITEISCKAAPFLFYSLADFSVLVILIMTGERFYAVWQPISNGKTNRKRRFKINLSVALIFCLLVNSHFVYTHSLNRLSALDEETSNSTDELVEPNILCEDTKWKEFYETYWVYIDASLYSFIPFIAITVLNILIIVTLKQAETMKITKNNKNLSLTSSTILKNDGLKSRASLISSELRLKYKVRKGTLNRTVN